MFCALAASKSCAWTLFRVDVGIYFFIASMCWSEATRSRLRCGLRTHTSTHDCIIIWMLIRANAVPYISQMVWLYLALFCALLFSISATPTATAELNGNTAKQIKEKKTALPRRSRSRANDSAIRCMGPRECVGELISPHSFRENYLRVRRENMQTKNENRIGRGAGESTWSKCCKMFQL